ncbi:hypothetical protein C7M61_004447 [Candidozyma pseudohaemuli]|uniref:Uncharacterized protein n=1 Tax=Candidozyma pseudohaemuli TaxID=418784 RepID=A0A2P7YI62_9ASCO|nr:hypothetical protein C7M61_004447 [[Candida] pseudohaemulonii]PSK35658.1 hypothetical protein C7M61_004447 [[Candida] pseudohaemulonii]
MVTAAGVILSTVLGASARRLQVQLVGKQFGRSWDRVPGYVLSIGAFLGGYAICDHFVERNRHLLTRRLAQLREQRAQVDAFHEFDLEGDHRITASKRTSKFFELFDKYGQNYK